MILKGFKKLKVLSCIHHVSLYHLGRRSVSSFQFLDLSNTHKGYSIIKMKKTPVNSFCLEFMKEFIDAIGIVEKDESSRGLVITSNLKVFGAGLDLTELRKPDKHRLDEFWANFQDLHLRLYSSPLVTIAAINGSAVAGACALTLTCDYRIMVDGSFKVGLNTVHTGILVPVWLAELYKLTMGKRKAEKYLSVGRLFSPQEAEGIGLVDCLVSSEELMSCASIEMQKWLAIPEQGRIKTKQLMRRCFMDEFHRKRDKDSRDFTTLITDPVFQEHLRSYKEGLKRK